MTVADDAPPAFRDGPPPADGAAMLGLYEHFERELDAAGFFHPPEKRPSMVQNLRSALGRASFTDQEVRTFRGVVTALSRGRGRVLAKLAAQKAAQKAERGGRRMSLRALLDSLPIPILQAPMAGAAFDAMAVAVSQAGGLGSLPPAGVAPDEIGPRWTAMRARTDAPFGGQPADGAAAAAGRRRSWTRRWRGWRPGTPSWASPLPGASQPLRATTSTPSSRP